MERPYEQKHQAICVGRCLCGRQQQHGCQHIAYDGVRCKTTEWTDILSHSPPSGQYAYQMMTIISAASIRCNILENLIQSFIMLLSVTIGHFYMLHLII